jgi:hypothetical protein
VDPEEICGLRGHVEGWPEAVSGDLQVLGIHPAARPARLRSVT